MIELSWLIGALMALAAGLWLLIGMGRQGRALGDSLSLDDRRQFNARAGRDQLRLLEQRLADGDIDAPQFEEARSQLEQALLMDLEPGSAPAAWQNQPWSLARKLAVPALAVLLSLGFFWFSHGQQHFDPSRKPASAQPSVDEMVAGLAARLQQEPDNLQGWIMLGRSYSVMRRYEEAAQAYAQANRLSPQPEPELLVAEAEALGLAQGQSLVGKPMQLINQALELDPENARGLWYALLAATHAGDAGLQQRYLARLEALPELPEQLADVLRREFNAQLAMDQGDTSHSGPRLRLVIDVTDQARQQLPDKATLFVFAKAQSGPPMPLAVSRQPLPGSWPVEVTLDDSMGMIEGMSLSSFDRWTVVARISAAGQATAQSGDWEARLQLDAATDELLQLTISQRIP